MKKLISFLIFILIIFSFFFFWRRIEETVKTWEDIETEDIVLKEDLEEINLEGIIKENALFDNYEYYLEDLNKDGFLEVLITSLSSEKSTAQFVLLSLIDKKGSFEKRGSFILEKEFSDIPLVERTQDIKNNNVKEIIINLSIGGVAAQTHAILEWQDGLRLINLEEKEEKKQAIFLIGSSAMHHQVYYLKDRQIIEVNAWTETDQELNCFVKVYELKNNIFSYNQGLSEELLETIKDDCLLEND